MRDLAKSMLRFGWAMSTFGARQAYELMRFGMRPSADGLRRASEAFDAVSHVAAEQMGEVIHDVYRAGDDFQEGLVDTVDRYAGDFGRGRGSRQGQRMNATWEALDRVGKPSAEES